MTIQCFGKLHILFPNGIVLESIPKDTKTLMSVLKTTYPILQGENFSIAVNKKLMTENGSIREGDEVALLPPFSGG